MTPLLTRPYSSKAQTLWRKYFIIKTSLTRTIWINVKCHRVHPIIFFVPSFNLRQKYMTGHLYVDSVIHIYWIKIFNFSIQFIWLNATYILLNFYRTKLYIYRAIGKTLCYHKMAFIWRFIFLCSVVSEHDFISAFIVIFNSMFILAGVISINFRLVLLTYQLPIKTMFYWENHITAKY